MYYQGWFTFPLGHYKDVFEHNTGLPYSKHWYYLEHWFDPAGTSFQWRSCQCRLGNGGARDLRPGRIGILRRRTIAEAADDDCRDFRTWGDYYDGRKIRFASFVPPGATT